MRRLPWFWAAVVASLVSSILGVCLLMFPKPWVLLERIVPDLSWAPMVDHFALPFVFLFIQTLAAVILFSSLICGVPAKDEIRCRKCGYILRGISEPRCSECGERI